MKELEDEKLQLEERCRTITEDMNSRLDDKLQVAKMQSVMVSTHSEQGYVARRIAEVEKEKEDLVDEIESLKAALHKANAKNAAQTLEVTKAQARGSEADKINDGLMAQLAELRRIQQLEKTAKLENEILLARVESEKDSLANDVQRLEAEVAELQQEKVVTSVRQVSQVEVKAYSAGIDGQRQSVDELNIALLDDGSNTTIDVVPVSSIDVSSLNSCRRGTEPYTELRDEVAEISKSWADVQHRLQTADAAKRALEAQATTMFNRHGCVLCLLIIEASKGLSPNQPFFSALIRGMSNRRVGN